MTTIRESDVLARKHDLERNVEHLKDVVTSIQRKLDGGSTAVTVGDLAARQKELIQAQDALAAANEEAAVFAR